MTKKKIFALILTTILCLTMSWTVAFATDEIPAGLPDGAIKIADGIYAYTPSATPRNYIGRTNIGTVPAYGTIVQPSAFSDTSIDVGHNWWCVQCTKAILINFVGGTHSVFGSDCRQWVSVGGNYDTIYYIDADTYNITRGREYQLQCTSVSASADTNVEISIWSKK